VKVLAKLISLLFIHVSGSGVTLEATPMKKFSTPVRSIILRFMLNVWKV
jgi:hypothetical protein